jgi:hypothetical protein
MDYRELLSSSLLSIGVDADQVSHIALGAEIYGEAGLLDSVYLVGLIAAIEESLHKALGTEVDLFGERDVALLDEFRNADTLVSFLDRHFPQGRAPREGRG